MPADAMIAVVWVKAQLHSQMPPAPAMTKPVTELLLEGFPARSLPSSANDHTVDLHIFLTPAELAALEGYRHRATTDPFVLYISIEAVAAGMRTFNEIRPGEPQEPSPWHQQLGLLSELMPFWNTKVDPLWVNIEQSTWLRQVLPGIGYDASRLVEIDFPQALPGHPGAAAEWDKARRAFDEQRYGDCVAECRDLLSMWRREFGATKGKSLAMALGERRRWADGDGRRPFIDSVWKAATDITNAPHHPEGQEAGSQHDGGHESLPTGGH